MSRLLYCASLAVMLLGAAIMSFGDGRDIAAGGLIILLAMITIGVTKLLS